MKDRSAATAPGLGYGIGIGHHDGLAVVRASPRLMLAAKPSGLSFTSASTPAGTEPGDVRDHEQLVDLGLECGKRLRELVRGPVRDDDRRHPHASTRR